MRHTRTLALKRETLSVLSTDEMASVAGGSHTCPITDGCTHGPSIDQTCPTVPPTDCFVITRIVTVC